METVSTFVAIVIIAFGILQFILFFKLWGMTNDIREMKNKYMNDIYKRTVEGSVEIKEKPQKSQSTTPSNKEPINAPKEETKITADKPFTTTVEIPQIDIENEDFKKLITRWQVLKKRGFIKQAVDEYIQKTSLPTEDAEKFIEEL